MTSDALQPEAREYAAWLGEVERRVVLPLKWLLLVLCAAHWMWSRAWELPSPAVFGLLISFCGTVGAEHYFFARDRVTPRQVRPFVYVSFVLDALFVTALIFMDGVGAQERGGVSEYFVLYILAVLRGFALFRTKMENFLSFVILSVMFLLVGSLQMNEASLTDYMPALRTLSIVWGVMIVTQAFIVLVNDRKEEQIRVRERLVRSASLASLGELSAGVAHEINNPIGIIKTYVDYLERSVRHDDPLREDFETIRKEAERCQQIVRRMLDFSNPQVQGFERVDVGELVEETVRFAFHQGTVDAIEAKAIVAPGLPPVLGDPVQLKQALLNIMMNARQLIEEYSKEGAPVGYEGRIAAEVSRGAGVRAPVRIEIRDNGPGISEADAERLFEPFFTRRRGGSGLGLSITRRIVEVHNGTIRIAPRPEGGAVVIIELPIADEEG
ncbi:hypothetical protein BH09SUM1_BH09SUM1_06930 [soil metagenome]